MNLPREIKLDPRLPWNSTGLKVEKGERYRLTVRTDFDEDGLPYADKTIPCTPDGPTGFTGWLMDKFARNARCVLNPARWLGPGKIKRLRVLRDREGTRASFLTVVGCIGRDDSAANTFVIGKGCEFGAYATGELVVFSNDWPGGAGEGAHRFDDSKSYANNKGILYLFIERL